MKVTKFQICTCVEIIDSRMNLLFTGCFAKAFQRVPRSMSSSVASAGDMSSSITTIPDTQRTLMYVFEVNLEIKEDDGRVSQRKCYLIL